jgi:hypothetical protein
MASIARLELADEGRARELAEQIRVGRESFADAAERCFLEAAERGTTRAPSSFARIVRRDADAALRELLFAAAPGELLGPIKTETRYTLVRVLKIHPARLDARAEIAIKDTLFKAWLGERRRAARIEWCWGNADKTG